MHAFITAAAIQFGGHFAKNIAPLKLYFSEDAVWNITTTRWGMFQSAVTLPCIFFPWFLGRTVDRKGNTKSVAVSALIFVCVGEMIFIMATTGHWFTGCLIGRFIFGIGEGLVSSISVFIAATSVPRFKMTAIGLTQSFHALAVACSKASLAVIAEAYHSYVAALHVSLFTCIASLCVGCIWKSTRDERFYAPLKTTHGRGNLGLSIDFWLVAGIHMTFSSAHRLFGHIDAPFLAEKFGHSKSLAGYASSITEVVSVFVSPLIGLFLDLYSTPKILPRILFLSVGVGAVAYLTLSSDSVSTHSMVYSLLFIGIINGITPTVMKSVIPETTHESTRATAFGIYESSEAVGVVVGSIVVGTVANIVDGGYRNCVYLFVGLLLSSTAMAGILLVRRETRENS
jgi:MFS family permease